MKTKTQPEIVTGIKLSSSHDTTSIDTQDDPSGINTNFQRDKILILKGALGKILAEISSLEAKYKSELTSAEEHSNRPWRFENNGDSQAENEDDNYELLVEKMKTAAHNLLRLRMTLADEFGIDDFKNMLSDNGPSDYPVQIQSSVYKLMKIVEGMRVSEKAAEERTKLILDSFKQPHVDTKAGLTKPVQISEGLYKQQAVGESRSSKLKERNWHSQNCKSFLDGCLGWDAVCCDEGELKPGFKFSMCCSQDYNKSNGEKLGICLPNPFGDQPCSTFT